MRMVALAALALALGAIIGLYAMRHHDRPPCDLAAEWLTDCVR